MVVFIMLVRGLYRGATPSFVGMAIESSLVFGIYSQTKASTAGLEIICRMQIQGTDSVVPAYRKYSGPLNCAIETVKTQGVKGLFRGGVATLLRESIGNAVFFTTYEYLRHSLHLQLKDSSFHHKNKNLVDVGIGICEWWSWWYSVLVCCSSHGCCKNDNSTNHTKI
ncbi:putative mitochondrial carrier domain superfamily [Helianthus annuus]|nr:putative mitochondrial carrier domain superfamily [Helianthus annuus]